MKGGGGGEKRSNFPENCNWFTCHWRCDGWVQVAWFWFSMDGGGGGVQLHFLVHALQIVRAGCLSTDSFVIQSIRFVSYWCQGKCLNQSALVTTTAQNTHLKTAAGSFTAFRLMQAMWKMNPQPMTLMRTLCMMRVTSPTAQLPNGMDVGGLSKQKHPCLSFCD